MCLVIDANCFSSVFNSVSQEHPRFAPVYKWVMKDPGGALIYGGTKYKKEVSLDRNGKYWAILTELEKRGRLIKVPDEKVDREAKRLRDYVDDPAFDDEHIVALVSISKCCVVCTKDQRAFPFLKRKDLYSAPAKPPKIYKSSANAKLCCAKNVATICRHN